MILSLAMIRDFVKQACDTVLNMMRAAKYIDARAKYRYDALAVIKACRKVQEDLEQYVSPKDYEKMIRYLLLPALFVANQTHSLLEEAEGVILACSGAAHKFQPERQSSLEEVSKWSRYRDLYNTDIGRKIWFVSVQSYHHTNSLISMLFVTWQGFVPAQTRRESCGCKEQETIQSGSELRAS